MIAPELNSLLSLTLLSVALLSSGCGEQVTCWCRCPPHGQAYEFSEVSSSPPTCTEICSAQGCTWEQESECLPDEVERCECEGSLFGLRSCNDSGFFEPCTNCNQRLCEEGASQLCECQGGGAGQRRCELGGWTEWEGCLEGCLPAPLSLELHGDLDQGDSGVVVSGSAVGEFDTTLWGCPAQPPGADSLVWLLPTRDASWLEPLRFDFFLPEDVLDLEIEYHHLTASEGPSQSALQIVINGVDHGEILAPTEGCVEAERIRYSLDSFSLGETNGLVVWSLDNGSGLDHGLQGVWIYAQVPAP